jgi:L-threonylcarbamoyladenylate synthase
MTLLTKDDAGSADAVVECLSKGGVVVLPTDTVYGLAVLPAFGESVARVFTLKGRPGSVNLPVMVSSPDDLRALGLEVSESASRLFDSPLVPGSLTVAMGFRGDERPRWLEGREEAAVRIPDDEWLLSVLRRSGPALVTSANAHGNETPENVREVLAQLHGSPDLAVDGGALRTIPSTLVNCRPDPPRVERVGAIPADEVMRYLR